jgi:predicted  nucleic acid-binding Zn-ribbon protein
MEIRRKHEKEFRNLQIQEARLARRREKEMAELLRLQKERKAKEAEALAQAARAYPLAAHRNQPVDLAAVTAALRG